MDAPIPACEQDRISRLRSLEIWETEAEHRFDRLVSIVCDLLDVPIALISFIEEDRQWFKAKVGTDVCGTSRETAFCSHTILGAGPFMVPDASVDPRFCENPLVTGDFGLKSYVGVPIMVDGLPVGSLCCMDTVPRVFSDRQLRGLSDLALQVVELLQVRVKEKLLSGSIESLIKSETGLRNAANRFNQFFQNMPLACFTCGQDGFIREWNPAAVRLYGIPADQAIGRPVVGTAVNPENDSGMQEIIGRAVRGEAAVAFEHVERLRDGSSRYLVSSVIALPGLSGDITRVLTVNVDITEQKQAHLAASRAGEHLNWSQSIANVGSFTRDLATNRVYWSDQMFEIFGHPVSSQPPDYKAILEHIHPEDQEHLNRFMRERVETWSSGPVEFRILCPNKAVKCLRMHYHPDESSGTVAGTIIDITERVESERAIRRAGVQIALQLEEIQAKSKDLEQKNREILSTNSELAQIVYATSHDLIEPLRMVFSFLELLREDCSEQLDPRGLEYVNFAIEGADRMRNLTSDLLEFSKIGYRNQTKISVDLTEAANQAVKNLAREIADSRAQVLIHELPMVIGDESLLVKLFENLFSNSIKFRSAGLCTIEVSGSISEDEVRIVAQDNGIGIDPRFHQEVFGLFKRLQPRETHPGSGIGLTMCRRIVQCHGGLIWIDSEIQDGSKIVFTLRSPAERLEKVA